MPTAMKPLASASVASRCVCGICGKQPAIEVSGTDIVTITANCCGQTQTKNIEKRELLFVQRFFVSESDDGGDSAPM